MKKCIFFSWPYSNNEFHLGHTYTFIPALILKNFGDVFNLNYELFSGSDQYGTPVINRAKKEKKSFFEISEKYHNFFKKELKKFNIPFSEFGKTNSIIHKKKVKEKILKLISLKKIILKEIEIFYCNNCNIRLNLRNSIGICFKCKKKFYKTCETCSEEYLIEENLKVFCYFCKKESKKKKKKSWIYLIKNLNKIHLFLEKKFKKSFFDRFFKILKKKNYFEVSRKIEWGINFPNSKLKVYVWFEALMGYLTLFEKKKLSWKKYEKIFYLGKDNVFFHLIILISILIDFNLDLNIIFKINNFLITTKGKISKSKNEVFLLKNFPFEYDLLFFFSIYTQLEKKDTIFSKKYFEEIINKKLIDNFFNSIRRVMKQINLKKINYKFNFNLNLEIYSFFLNNNLKEGILKLEKNFFKINKFFFKKELRENLNKNLNFLKFWIENIFFLSIFLPKLLKKILKIYSLILKKIDGKYFLIGEIKPEKYIFFFKKIKW